MFWIFLFVILYSSISYLSPLLYYLPLFTILIFLRCFLFFIWNILSGTLFFCSNFYLRVMFIFTIYRFFVLDTFLNWIFNSHCTCSSNAIDICYRFFTTGIIIIPCTIVFSWQPLMFVLFPVLNWWNVLNCGAIFLYVGECVDGIFVWWL